MINIEAKQATIIARQHIAITTNDNINIFDFPLTKLKQQFYGLIKNRPKNKVAYRIIFADKTVMQAELPLPNADLNAYEIKHYIKNSLAKIFHTKQRLCYDYLPESGGTNSKSLTIYAYHYEFIERYIALFAQDNLSFVGITTTMIENGANTPLPIADVELLALLPTLTGINFLPWREKQQKYKRTHFLAVIAGYFLIYSVIVWLWDQQAYPHLNEQLLINQQYHTELTQKNQQLVQLIKLNNTWLQLKSDLAKQDSLKQQLTLLVNYLTLIAKTVPDGIWLSSLSYQGNILELKGESFFYADILTFSNLLYQHDITGVHKIVSIKKQQYLLEFTFDIQLAYLVQQNAD
ncbi:PilN domain-containing protein [Orbus wheelerorum]|uniref:PilN domain-containing protein n=1 Tax=Orbus wheelerorum TaxID=3074111 RepID=UPI00370CFE2F